MHLASFLHSHTHTRFPSSGAFVYKQHASAYTYNNFEIKIKLQKKCVCKVKVHRPRINLKKRVWKRKNTFHFATSYRYWWNIAEWKWDSNCFSSSFFYMKVKEYASKINIFSANNVLVLFCLKKNMSVS